MTGMRAGYIGLCGLAIVAVLLAAALGRGDSGAWAPRAEAAAPATAPAAAPQAAEIERLAKTDLVALLELAIKHYDESYRDYTCVLAKQERVGGELGAVQVVEVKFRGSPFSVAMRWLSNPAGADRVIYVEGENGGHMLAHPTGLLGVLTGWMKLSPTGPRAMKNNLRPITAFGFRRNMEEMVAANRRARDAGDLKWECEGEQVIAESGRGVLLIVRRLPQKPEYIAAVTKIYLDREYLLPVKVEGYDWQGRLTFTYLYKDIRFNVGLGASDFVP